MSVLNRYLASKLAIALRQIEAISNDSDTVYNAVFQTNVADGAANGGCQDNINPPTRFTLADPFWVANGALPLPAVDLVGCGRDMSGWAQPIVRLGGWNANTTSLAYRDLGNGRVWLVETDWQDNNAGFGAEARQMMRHMIFNGRRLGVPLGLNRGFGHHGGCNSWNLCNDARTCANAACQLLQGAPAVSYQEGLCTDLKASVPGGMNCELFSQLPNDLDSAWGGGCNIPVAYNVVCGAPPEQNADCANNPLWQRVACQTGEWVWTSSRVFNNLATAEANRTLFSASIGDQGANGQNALCSLNGQGFVSTQTFQMAQCDTQWFHIGGRFTGNCGGHNGETVRRLVTGNNGCYDYRNLPIP